MIYLFVIAAYLVGSIPFGLILGWVLGGGDVRSRGSGNIGATNVMRSIGVTAGIATFLLDFFKGTIMVVVARHYGGVETAALVAIAVVVGHNFPVFLKFKGGRGVASGAGVFMGLVPISVAIVLAIFAIVVGTTRIVSLASLIASGAFPPVAWALGAPWQVVAAGTVVVALIFLRHSANIGRLIRGEEPRFGSKKEKAS